MPRKPPPPPTDAELEVLRILWRRGPSTVRQVHEELARQRGLGYTGALKLLQVMHQKGLVARDEAERAHVYRAVPGQEGMLRRLTHDLLDKAFGGAVDQLVLHALKGKKTSREDVEKIRRMLDELEESGQ